MKPRRRAIRLPMGAMVALAVLGVAAGGFALRQALRDDAGPTGGSDAIVETVDLAATDALDVTGVDDLVAAATCVARGRVAAVERGRTIGGPDAAVVSRIVTIEVDRVVGGTCLEPLLVEEEGWLPDGAPVTVNGWSGSAVGDEGVWFLVRTGDPEVMPYATTVATSGALRWRDGVPLVPTTAPAWVSEAMRAGPDALAAELDAAAPTTGG